VPPGIVI